MAAIAPTECALAHSTHSLANADATTRSPRASSLDDLPRRARARVRRLFAAYAACAFLALVCAARALARLKVAFVSRAISLEVIVASYRAASTSVTSERATKLASDVARARGVARALMTLFFTHRTALVEGMSSIVASIAARALSEEVERAEEGARVLSVAASRAVELQTTHANTAGGVWGALKRGDERGVRACCDERDGACLRERGPVGETPLHLMLLYGGSSDIEGNAQLRSAKAIGTRWPATLNDLYVGSEYFGESCLHIAIVNKNRALVDWLLTTTPDVATLLAARATGRFFSRGQPCYYGEYALSFAVSTGQGDLVRQLLERGADAMARDTNGNTCLHLAAIHNQPEIFKLVCDMMSGAGAKSARALEDVANADGLTPLLFCASHGYLEMFNFLIDRLCVTEWSYGPVTCRRVPLLDIDTKQRATGRCALEHIVERGHIDLLGLPIIQELLQRKWDVYIGRLFYARIAQLFAFLITMTTVHVTSLAESSNDLGLISTIAHTAKTAILAAVTAQLLHEYANRADASGQSAVSVIFCITYLASVMFRTVSNLDLVADALLACSFLAVWFYFTLLFMGFKSTGHFVIMVYEIIMDDVRPFGVILGLFVVAFSTAIYIILQPISSRSVASFGDQLLSCFEWLTGGGFERDVVETTDRGDAGKAMIIILLASFTILGAIVLLNLLVAMMGDTYARVSENAVAKWQLERARIMLRLERGIPRVRRDRLARDVWIEIDGARCLQVQLVDGKTALENAQRD